MKQSFKIKINPDKTVYLEAVEVGLSRGPATKPLGSGKNIKLSGLLLDDAKKIVDLITKNIPQ